MILSSPSEASHNFSNNAADGGTILDSFCAPFFAGEINGPSKWMPTSSAHDEENDDDVGDAVRNRGRRAYSAAVLQMLRS